MSIQLAKQGRRTRGPEQVELIVLRETLVHQGFDTGRPTRPLGREDSRMTSKWTLMARPLCYADRLDTAPTNPHLSHAGKGVPSAELRATQSPDLNPSLPIRHLREQVSDLNGCDEPIESIFVLLNEQHLEAAGILQRSARLPQVNHKCAPATNSVVEL